jgi:hypothetical protein
MEINLNNPDHAYIIGMLQADGNIQSQNKKRISLELKDIDIDILIKIQSIINSDHCHITKRERTTNFGYINTVNLRIGGIDIVSEFEKYIPSGKKSLIIERPDGIIERDYWRGIIDGDGSLGITANNIPFISLVTNSDKLAQQYKEYVKKVTGQSLLSKPNTRDKAYNLMLSNESAQRLVKELYYSKCLSLNRKQLQSVNILKWIRPDNIKKRTWQKKVWTKEDDHYILTNDILDSITELNRTEKSIKTRLWRLNKDFTI